MNILTLLFGEPSRSRTTIDTDTDIVRAIILRRPDLTQLDVLRTVYLVQVMHVGRHAERILPDWFEATLLGPYNIDLARICRSRLVRRRRDAARLPGPTLSPRVLTIVEELCASLGDAPGARLHKLTSMDGGAWYRLWEPDPRSLLPMSDPRSRTRHGRPSDRGPVIGFSHMIDDYRVITQPVGTA